MSPMTSSGFFHLWRLGTTKHWLWSAAVLYFKHFEQFLRWVIIIFLSYRLFFLLNSQWFSHYTLNPFSTDTWRRAECRQSKCQIEKHIVIFFHSFCHPNFLFIFLFLLLIFDFLYWLVFPSFFFFSFIFLFFQLLPLISFFLHLSSFLLISCFILFTFHELFLFTLSNSLLLCSTLTLFHCTHATCRSITPAPHASVSPLTLFQSFCIKHQNWLLLFPWQHLLKTVKRNVTTFPTFSNFKS